MSILNHFQNLSLSTSQEVALAHLESFLEGQKKVFILKGYAGSGKTTILKGLIDYLINQEREVDVIAPTGRAAKVLRDKTLRGSTIHRGIYNLEKLVTLKAESDDDAEKSFHFNFPIAEKNSVNRVIIVDEASMVSNVKSQHELFTFGTGKLLNDLLTYSKINTTNNKIIFVGDPAQLPPVLDSKSIALDVNFFLENGISCEETEMTDVIRQDGNTLILKNATRIRNLLSSQQRNKLKYEFDESNFQNLSIDFGPSKYVELFPKPRVGNGVIISFSNRQAFSNNTAIRDKIFSSKKDITVGDIVILNNNNYHTYGTELFNGDMAEVVEVSNKLVSQSTPVYISEGTKKVKKVIKLDFREVSLKFPNHPDVINCKIIDSFLNSPSSALSVTELKALYINFTIRFKEIQKIRKEQSLTYFSEGSAEFKDALKADPFFNALKIKYAYSITCHKSQGSEWDTTIVDFRGRIGLSDDCLRWSYTAITRSKETCFCIGPPNFDVFDLIEFKPASIVKTIPIDFFHFSKGVSSPFHNENIHPCKATKYQEISLKFQDTPFVVQSVDSQDYKEIYVISHENENLKMQGDHDSKGLFKEFKLISGDKITGKMLLEIVNKAENIESRSHYVPTNESFDKLFSKVSGLAIECKLSITNIVEYNSNYYINYYFQFFGKIAYLQFYFDGNNKFTKVYPRYLKSLEFSEFDSLISKFNQSAS